MQKTAVAILIIALVAAASGLHQDASRAAVAGNPIRKVVTLLQRMQKKVEAEGKAGQDLFDKYMCFCKSGAGDLEKTISAAETKIPQVESAIKEADAAQTQLKADLKSHKADRNGANGAMATASVLREKEAKAFASTKSDLSTNIAAIKSAVSSLEAGMAGFLQTGTASVLRKLFQTEADVSDIDRQDVMAFLAGGAQQSNGYSPQGGQITGILKQLGDDMQSSLTEAEAEEKSAISNYEGLMAAKTKEVAALTQSIEHKTVRSGELAVKIVQMKEDVADTEAALKDDTAFLKDLDKNCAQKEAEWAVITKTRSDELVCLADTIKLLNDDEALELFKRTLPSAASSFVQVDALSANVRSRATAMIRSAHSKALSPDRHNLDFVLLALQGRGAGFANVIKMIDEMIVRLKIEQKNDDSKQEYCAKELDSSDDKKKGLELSISDAEKSAADAEDAISVLASEIKALQEGIKALDAQVSDATIQREKENAEFTELMASNTGAVDLIGLAKNRLNQFYNPALHVPEAKRELSEADSIVVGMGGTAPPTPAPGGIAGTGIMAAASSLVQVSAHDQQRSVDRPAPAPEAPTYAAKAEESTGVISMMDMLIQDLETEMTEAQTAEKDNQADYEQMATDSAVKRMADSKSIMDKESSKAGAEAMLQHRQEEKRMATKELLATLEFIASLHSECDWLMSNMEMRKEARANEIESLGKAKAVLSGADFSLLQPQHRSLRGQA